MDTIAHTHTRSPAFALDLPQLEIRAVREEEIQMVAEIITRSFHFDRGWMSWFAPLFKLGIAEDLRHRLRSSQTSEDLARSPQQHCAIALCTDRGRTQVAGTVEVGLRTNTYRQPKPHRYVYISNLAVSKDYRRRGIAQQLLLDCERIAKEWGYLQLYLHVMGDNQRGRNLYQKLGYEVVSSEYVWSFIPWRRPERLFLRKVIN